MSKPKAEVTQPETGSFSEPLDPPEQAGTISVAEAAEIRERKRLIEAAQDRLKAMQEEASDLSKTIQLLRVENRAFLESLCRARGLSLQDGYNVESDTGVIWRTARFIDNAKAVADSVPAEPEVVVQNGM